MKKSSFIEKLSENSKEPVNKSTPIYVTRAKSNCNTITAKFPTISSHKSFPNNLRHNKKHYGALESYTKITRVGKGSYSTVYKAYSFIHKTHVAMKETKIENSEGVSATTLREVSILKQLNHPNIVGLLDIIYGRSFFYLVLEFAPFNLIHIQRKYSSGMPTGDSIIFSYQLLNGLAYCHEQNMIHRDIKPRNILITEMGILKIADFGLARCLGVPVSYLTSNVITLWYRPPDILLGNTQYGYSADMWSTGCMIFELFTTTPLFSGNNEQDQLDKIIKKLGPINDTNLPLLKTNTLEKATAKISMNLSTPTCCCAGYEDKIPEPFKNLISRLIIYNPIERATAEECLKHHCFEMIFKIIGEDKNDSSLKIAKYLSSKFFMIMEAQELYTKPK